MKIKDVFKVRFWKSLWRLFSLNDKKLFKIGASLIIVSLFFIFWEWYFHSTELTPKQGGLLREAYIGQPVSLNPILSQSEADQEISSLVFNGILKSNNDGEIEYDLAKQVEQSVDGKTWNITLRDDVFWHDGKQLDADDVIFTIKAIQNPDSRSLFQQSWQGVDVKKESKYDLVFSLNSTFTFFEENLKQKIAPEHIFKDIPLSNLYLSQYNFEPVGTGPYVFESFNKSKEGFITSYNFQSNQEYFLGKPLIDGIMVKFYKSEPEMIKAFNNRQVDFLNGISASRLEDVKRKFSKSAILLPRYFAVFFNSNINPIFAEEEVRQALNLAVDRKELTDKIFDDRVQLVGSSLLSGMPGYEIENEAVFSLEEANNLLEEAGWEDENGDGILEKDLGGEEKTDLSFQIISPEAGPLIETTSILKKQWAKIGAKMEIKIVPQNDLQGGYFRSRVYDSILFGNILNHQPDLFPFWHSSQKFHPGFNLALYEDKKVDQLLEDIRQEMDPLIRSEKLTEVQEIISEEVPAIFLFNPYYNIIYVSNLHLGDDYPDEYISKFNSSSEKYFNIHKWYLKTDRGFR